MPTPRVVFAHVWSRAVTRQATWTDRVLTYLSAWPIDESQMPGGITQETLDRLGDGRAAFAGLASRLSSSAGCREDDASIRVTCEQNASRFVRGGSCFRPGRGAPLRHVWRRVLPNAGTNTDG
jgi:hypothetical protein